MTRWHEMFHAGKSEVRSLVCWLTPEVCDTILAPLPAFRCFQRICLLLTPQPDMGIQCLSRSHRSLWQVCNVAGAEKMTLNPWGGDPACRSLVRDFHDKVQCLGDAPPRMPRVSKTISFTLVLHLSLCIWLLDNYTFLTKTCSRSIKCSYEIAYLFVLCCNWDLLVEYLESLTWQINVICKHTISVWSQYSAFGKLILLFRIVSLSFHTWSWSCGSRVNLADFKVYARCCKWSPKCQIKMLTAASHLHLSELELTHGCSFTFHLCPPHLLCMYVVILYFPRLGPDNWK